DALDEDERAAYEAHLARCEPCREELGRLGETAASMALGVESPAPPPALRRRILDAAAAERENVVPLRSRRSWAGRVSVIAAAAAACVAVAFGVWAATLSNSLDAERAARAADARAMAIYTNPDSRRVALRGGSGAVAVEPNGSAALVVHRLPAAPSGETYEAWGIPQGAKPVPAGTFRGGGPTTVPPLPQS